VLDLEEVKTDDDGEGEDGESSLNLQEPTARQKWSCRYFEFEEADLGVVPKMKLFSLYSPALSRRPSGFTVGFDIRLRTFLDRTCPEIKVSDATLDVGDKLAICDAGSHFGPIDSVHDEERLLRGGLGVLDCVPDSAVEVGHGRAIAASRLELDNLRPLREVADEPLGTRGGTAARHELAKVPSARGHGRLGPDLPDADYDVYEIRFDYLANRNLGTGPSFRPLP